MRRFNSSQRMCGVGSFQHGSGSTKNSTAGPCQTILVPDVSANGERRGGKNRSSHIKHVPVEIQALAVSVCLSQQEKKSWFFEDFIKRRMA